MRDEDFLREYVPKGKPYCDLCRPIAMMKIGEKNACVRCSCEAVCKYKGLVTSQYERTAGGLKND